MPYPALPPELPPSTPAVSSPTVSHSESVSVVASAIASTQTANTGTLTRPTPPETFPPETTPAPVTTAEFVQQAASSSAALLGETESVGYLLEGATGQMSSAEPSHKVAAPPEDTAKPALVTVRETQPSAGIVSGGQASSGLQKPPLSLDVAEPTNRPKPKLPQVPLPPAIAAKRQEIEATGRSPSAIYSLSGVSKQTSQQLETELIKSLDQAVSLEQVAADALAAEFFPEADQPQSNSPEPDSVAQAGTPPLIVQPRETTPSEPQPAPAQAPTPTTPPAPRVVELTADRQDYDENRQVFTAEGNVKMRFQGALLDADRLQVNLVNRIAVAEGNVALTRGTQVLRGQRFEYNFVQGSGTVTSARGEINIPTAGTDFGAMGGGVTGDTVLGRPVSDRVTSRQPLTNVSGSGGVSVGIGVGRDVSRVPGAVAQGGSINRVRFEAERIDFTPEGWEAVNVQLTNDPFSPPELVIRADRAKLTRLSPLQDEVRATRPRLVFDQRVSIPILLSRTVIDRRRRQPPIARFGFDDSERGGLFIERPFEFIFSERVQLTLTPQYFLQRAIFDSGEGGPFGLANYGLRARLDATLSPRTTLIGSAVFTSFEPDEIPEKVRASVRARQWIGTHSLALEYSYRDRLFNGSLGFQTVRSSLGAVLTSPVIALGKTGINLTYQAGFQNITSDTDRLDLLPTVRDNNRINLSRFQAVAQLNRGFYLWQGKPLPATPTEGLRYSPVPLVPFIFLDTGLSGVTSIYSNGDTQNNLFGTVALLGQFGRFSRRFFDYASFNIRYTQQVGAGASPFLFDRTVDNRVLSFGITQQVVGPFRVGFQTSVNLDNDREISTDYSLEYSRRTYSILVRYNPVLSIGSLNLRINDFNWTGGSLPFDADVTPVEGGVRLREE
jgi:hypothetical protein